MKPSAVSVISMVAGAALGAPAFAALVSWAQSPWLYPSNPVETGVFWFVLLRALLFVAALRFRRIKPGDAVLLLSGDVVIIPIVLALFLVTGDPTFGSFGGAYLASWLSSALLLYAPVAAISVAVSMARRSRLVAVASASAGALTLSALVLRGVESAYGDYGLSAVVRWTLGGLKGQFTPSPDLSALMLGCSALLFVALTAYSVAAGAAEGAQLVPGLSLAVFGAALLLVWVQLTSVLAPWEALDVPAAALVGTVWVLTRER